MEDDFDKLEGQEDFYGGDQSDREDDDADTSFPSVEEKSVQSKKKKKIHFGSFRTMGLSSEVFKGISRAKYNIPTPIQRKTLPISLSGSDLVAMARTGSGKTAAFLIPMLEKLKTHSPTVGARALILSPTRELAIQTQKFIKQLGYFTGLRSIVLVGGDSMATQFSDLATNPDIIVATPGRLMHHLKEIEMKLTSVEYIVFDEADRLFEQGYAEQLKEIMSGVPESRQTLLFSATLPSMLVEFARAGLRDPKIVRLDTEIKFSENLKMSFFTVRTEEKTAALLYVLKNLIPANQQTIVFVATRHHAEYLYELLKFAARVPVTVIYGSMDQASRTINIGKFRKRVAEVLIVTDVAARGIDIPMLDNVINYDFPPRPKLFVHRAGRAARAGRTGMAFSLVATDELPYMVDVFTYTNKRPINEIPPGETFHESQIYYGKIPQESLDLENDAVNEILFNNQDLMAQKKTTQNAYKLYYQTRAKADADSVKKAKNLSLDKINPLITAKFGDVSMKENVLNSLKLFRPSQTIFEIDATHKSAPVVEIMEKKRKFHEKVPHAITRMSELMNPSKRQKLEEDPEEESDDPMEDIKEEPESDDEEQDGSNSSESEDIEIPDVGLVEDEDKIKSERESTKSYPAKKKKKTNFVDKEYYMAPLKAGHKMDKAMSISSDLKDAVLDFGNQDENYKTAKAGQQRIVWDRKKKKFVTVNGGQSIKTMRNEAGKIINEKDKPGKIYEEWKKRNKTSIPMIGQAEDASMTRRFGGAVDRFRFKSGRFPKDDQPVESNSIKKFGNHIRSELKPASQVTKERKEKEKKLAFVRERRLINSGKMSREDAVHSKRKKSGSQSGAVARFALPTARTKRGAIIKGSGDKKEKDKEKSRKFKKNYGGGAGYSKGGFKKGGGSGASKKGGFKKGGSNRKK